LKKADLADDKYGFVVEKRANSAAYFENGGIFSGWLEYFYLAFFEHNDGRYVIRKKAHFAFDGRQNYLPRFSVEKFFIKF
jgi:hypothetical protein